MLVWVLQFSVPFGNSPSYAASRSAARLSERSNDIVVSILLRILQEPPIRESLLLDPIIQTEAVANSHDTA